MMQKEGHCRPCSFASFAVASKVILSTSPDASEEVSSFRRRPDVWRDDLIASPVGSRVPRDRCQRERDAARRSLPGVAHPNENGRQGWRIENGNVGKAEEF